MQPKGWGGPIFCSCSKRMENANQKSISWNMELLETKCFFVSFFISAGEGFRSFLKIAAPSGMVPTPLFFFLWKISKEIPFVCRPVPGIAGQNFALRAGRKTATNEFGSVSLVS